jgi:LysM repeat protein
MKSVGQLFLGLLTALGSGLLVIAAASLALVEGGGFSAPRPTNTAINITNLATSIFMEFTLTPIPITPTRSCPYPEGWIPYNILSDDTLEKLAAEWGTTTEELHTKNCLLSDSLVIGSTLYHPVSATLTLTSTLTLLATTPAAEMTLTETITATRVLCGPPSGWVPYYVKHGDTLFRIGLAYGLTVDYLMFTNCLTSDAIQVGQRLFVPNISTRVPSPTQTATEEPPPPKATPTPTRPPTFTPTLPPPPTDVPTDIPTDIPTSQPIPTDSYPPYPPQN